MFRSVIRRGANRTAQFAGHYTVPMWGCGTGCIAFIIVDSITGHVYNGHAVSSLPDQRVEEYKLSSTSPVVFNVDSELLKINGCPTEHECALYDCRIVAGKGLKLIREERLPQKYQPK